MKKPIVILLICCLALTTLARDQKLALLVGVGQYPAGNGWPAISAANDLAHLEQVLARWGFDPAGVLTLRDEQATRAGILAAIQRHLIQQAKPGAFVYFHFSGHGQQVADNNGDETDGWDEPLVPFDSPAQFAPGQNEGQYLLRDDDLYGLLRQLRARIGPAGQLWVTIDACHSGTATRGLVHARGTAEKMAPAKTPALPDDGIETLNDTAELAPMTAFFASSAHELNYETTDENGHAIGSLSYAVFSVLSRPLAKRRYRELFDLVRRHIAMRTPGQTPVAEGSLENFFLDRTTVPLPVFFPVLEWIDNRSLRTGGGLAFGIAEGARVLIYRADQTDTSVAAPLARGEILASSLQQCVVQLEHPLSREQALDAKMTVEKAGLGKYTCTVQVSQLPPVYASGVREILKNYAFVTFSNDAADVIIRPAGVDQGFEMVNTDGAAIRRYPPGLSPELLAAETAETLLAYAKTDFLKRLDYDADGLEAELLLERAASNGEWIACRGVAEMAIGDSFRISIQNRSRRHCYFALLHIGSDGILHQLAPASDDEQNMASG